MRMLNITSTLNDDDNNMQDFNKVAVKTNLLFFSFPRSMDFAGLCYPVSSNPDLSGREGQIGI